MVTRTVGLLSLVVWTLLAGPVLPAGPAMNIDIPAPNSVMAQGFYLAGWAVDTDASSGTGVAAVDVWGYPNPGSGAPPVYFGSATYGGARPDIGAAFGSQFTNSGWQLLVTGRPPGVYGIHVHALSTVTGTFNQVQTRTVTLTANPRMSVDIPNTPTAVQSFTIAGWALDLASASGTGVSAVHVWSQRLDGPGGAPEFVGHAAYGFARPDVGAVFGAQFTNSGYTQTVAGLTPGRYLFTVYAWSTVSASFNQAQAFDIDVDPTVVAPTLTPLGGTYQQELSVSASTTTPEAVVRYTTDGSTPTTSSPVISPSQPLAIQQSTTVKARAFRSGWVPSQTTTALYALQAQAPEFSMPSGTYHQTFTVTLSSPTPNVTLRYTTNGVEPTEASPAATAVAITGPVVLKVKAFRSGWTPSATSTATYSMQAAAPVFSVPPGAFTAPFTVTVTSSTPSTQVRYTTNGTEPTASSPLLSSLQYAVSSTVTLKVKAFRSGWTPSATTTAVWRSTW